MSINISSKQGCVSMRLLSAELITSETASSLHVSAGVVSPLLVDAVSAGVVSAVSEGVVSPWLVSAFDTD